MTKKPPARKRARSAVATAAAQAAAPAAAPATHGFNASRFEAAKMTPRTKGVPVEALADFFDGLAKGEVPQWIVRGLTATELHRAIEAGKRNNDIDAIIKGINANAELTQAVRQILGLTNNTPGEIAKRMAMLVLGSVAPKIDEQTSVRLAERFPVDFMHLTNEISVLTGQGYDLVKPSAASQPTTA